MLVLLPGMMCDARLFGPQIAGLPGPVVVPDLGGQDSVGALAAQVLAQVDGAFALAGLSMGGIVAMEVMRQALSRVTHLALIDTNPLAELPAVQARRAPQIAAVQAGRLEQVMRNEMKPNYLVDSPDMPRLLDLCMAMALDLGPQAFVNQSIALRDRPDQCDTLRGVRVPTLILCGRHDRLCPVERHQLMHALIPHSTLEIIENAGHLPTLEQPQHTNAALRRWLEAA